MWFKKSSNNFKNIRKKNLKQLKAFGFRVSSSLPISDATVVRSQKEIVARLYALLALVCWVVFKEEDTSSERIKAFLQRNQLKNQLTDTELNILSLSREQANEQHADTIGWYLENMWALSWVLGFEVMPEAHIGQLPNEVTEAMIYDFLPNLDSTIDDLIQAHAMRSSSEIVELEDLFYCAHNAVRSAQLGGETVPNGFHPIADGGAIHERRHSLTWCLSPGIEWEETDLST